MSAVTGAVPVVEQLSCRFVVDDLVARILGLRADVEVSGLERTSLEAAEDGIVEPDRVVLDAEVDDLVDVAGNLAVG
ncbi:hypothetical protein D3C86_2097930 [compost metagenome]